MSDYFRHSQIRRAPVRKGKNYLWAGISLAVLMIIAFFWYQNERYQYLLQTPANLQDTTQSTFIIKQGDSIPVISAKLLEKKLILDDAALNRYLKENNLDRTIVAGRFLLSPSQTIPQISETITNSKNSEAVVTIPEGSTIQDIDKKLVSLNLAESGEFIRAVGEFSSFEDYPFLDKTKNGKLLHPLEGYLFPDTYFIDPVKFDGADLIQLMLKNFARKTAEFYSPHIIIMGKERSFYDLISMASIVEKEVRTQKDLPVVAGILWKRLDSRWQLGADATLLYLNQENREIDYRDLQEENDYNTRKNQGLPPGPICNPGIRAIMAALNPEESPYFYYLTKPETGEVVYAQTNDEHNQNKYKYLNN